MVAVPFTIEDNKLTLIDRISAELTQAMRDKAVVRLGTLRMAKAALMNREIERGHALDDAESLQVVAALIKQRRDSIEQFRGGGRDDLADKEAAEIAVLEGYLPPPVDPAELARTVDDTILELGANSARDMGRVMKAVLAKFGGRTADGKLVSELVKRKLSGA
ncbi:MAG TPA: GatB/YqeY domain-containing protein [Vicinamibacterales bacterium]|nr:GatB/YqeY domain-containing protein [Vicinamibacterales bacterium]